MSTDAFQPLITTFLQTRVVQLLPSTILFHQSVVFVLIIGSETLQAYAFPRRVLPIGSQRGDALLLFTFESIGLVEKVPLQLSGLFCDVES